MRMLLLLGLVSSAGLYVHPSFGGSIAMGQPQSDPTVRPKRGPVVQFSSGARGTVVAVGKDNFTIETEKKQKRHFVVGEIMFMGRKVAALESHSYRLNQLQVGDILHIDFDHFDGVEVATYFLIWRRPGGVVPEQPATSPTAGVRAWHRRMNAYQDWEERGIPLPPEYRDRPNDVNPRFVPKPVAPPPREVTRPPAP